MNRMCALVAAATVIVALGGCSKGSDAGPSSTTTSSTTTASATTVVTTPTTSSSSAGKGTSAAADLPDPCTLLTDAEVTELTGRAVTQTDRDSAEPGAPNRYCQWQQDSGQLAVFLQRTTKSDFDAANSAAAGATPVADVGDAAYAAEGHLYVLSGTMQLDVYARGASDDQNLADAKKVAGAVLPKLKS